MAREPSTDKGNDMQLGAELIKDIKDTLKDDNGLTVKQRDRLFLTTVSVILEQQQAMIEQLEPLADIKKKIETIPPLVWAIFEKPRQFITVIIIVFILMSMFYVKETRDAFLAFLASLVY